MNLITTDSAPIACDLSALDPQQRARHAALWQQTKALASAPVRTSHGVAFHFDPDAELAHDLIELATFERRCCPFLRITVMFEPEDGPLTLELSGNHDIHTFLVHTFGVS